MILVFARWRLPELVPNNEALVHGETHARVYGEQCRQGRAAHTPFSAWHAWWRHLKQKVNSRLDSQILDRKVRSFSTEAEPRAQTAEVSEQCTSSWGQAENTMCTVPNAEAFVLGPTTATEVTRLAERETNKN